MLRNTVIPEAPMFKPEIPPQEPEHGVVVVKEYGKPEDRVESALKCLPHYDPASRGNVEPASSFRYWKIRDYAHAYRSRLVTPSMVAEYIIPVIEEFSSKKPPPPLLISFDAEEVRKQAAASTQRFDEGKPLSILDGIFMAIKDDIDCFPHPSKGASTWMHEFRSVNKDSVSVSKLRSCGVIFLGKANMHEFGMGTTGNNPNYGTKRNPHAPERYTPGSSSGPAAIVAFGLCSTALGTDGGGSIRIPSSLCGVVGLKSTYGRTDMEIPYPFGVSEGCSIDPNFVVNCNKSFSQFQPILGNLTVTNISLQGQFEATMHIAKDCYEQGVQDLSTWNVVWLLTTVNFTVSSTQNKFVVVGCDTNAYLYGSQQNESYRTGCASACESTRYIANGLALVLGAASLIFLLGLEILLSNPRVLIITQKYRVSILVAMYP
ncbi:hypothetical protein SO802_010922 [Lithocarpus litseifolius]|uniref:Amidase domain-containing protein n=1 Tax=Lithocarpus litseifolius TaxID=425828 RepID=A0AAW2DFJ3_9ROSI